MLKQGETVHIAIVWRINKYDISGYFPLTEYETYLFLCILEVISYIDLHETLQFTVDALF